MTQLPDDQYRVERRAVARSFDRASATYDGAASLQTQVRTELLDRLQFLRVTPAAMLDLGSGTGLATIELARLFPLATVVALDIAPGMLTAAGRAANGAMPWAGARRALRGLLGSALPKLPTAMRAALALPPARVCADSLQLPFAAGSVDVVFSSLMLQWCDDLDVVLSEIRRVLRPGGLLLFSTFGPETLQELRAAWHAADGQEHVNRFLDVHDIGSALTRGRFSEPVLDVDRITLHYTDARNLMHELKMIGAHNVMRGRSRGLTGRQRLQRMLGAYEQFRTNGHLPATYEVIYGCAWLPPETATRDGMNDGDVTVAISAIGRRRRD